MCAVYLSSGDSLVSKASCEFCVKCHCLVTNGLNVSFSSCAFHTSRASLAAVDRCDEVPTALASVDTIELGARIMVDIGVSQAE